jgi:hypothetical protein
MNYYRLEQSLADNYVVETDLNLPLTPNGHSSTCFLGREILVPVPNPVEIDLGRLDGTNPRHYMTGADAVIISDLLLEVFKKAGVDNFQVFPAVLHDRQSNRKWDNYYLFNEIGVRDAVLLEECEYHLISEGDEAAGRYPGLGFMEVVLSAEKLKDEPKMFRLVQEPDQQLYLSEEVMVVLRKMSPPEKWGVGCEKTEVK